MRTKSEIEIDIENKGWEVYYDMDGIHINNKLPVIPRNYFVIDIYNKVFYTNCHHVELELMKLINELIGCILQGRNIINENNN